MAESKGLMASLMSMPLSPDEVTCIGDAAIESEIFLTALEAECTPEEFAEICEESMAEMAIYNLVADPEIATEATKSIVKMNKSAKFSAIERRAAIRLAEKANDPAYTKYAKGRKLMLENRDTIYKKYGAKAKSEAKKVIQNSRRKASAMNSDAGHSIVDKMDRQIAKATK